MNAHAKATEFQTSPIANRSREPLNSVRSIATSLNAAFLRVDHLQEKQADQLPSSWEKSMFGREEVHAADQVYALKTMLSLVQATDLTEAAVQLVEAINIVDLVWEGFPCEDGVEIDHQTKADFRALNRLLYSALAVVNTRAEERISDLLPRYYGDPNLSPWVTAEDKLAEINRRDTRRSGLGRLADEYRRVREAFNSMPPETEDSPEWLAADDAIDQARDAIFLYRPRSMEEVAEKASILFEIHDQAEGLNENRIKQMFEAFGA